MRKLLKAVCDIQRFLKKRGIPYMIIGGIANLVWGEPRTTLDIDITVSIPQKEVKSFIDEVDKKFRILVHDPEEFVKKTHVLPIETDSIRIDVIFAGLDYEKEAIKRALDVEVEEGIKVRVCAPEDLIIYKAVSERERDWEDIEGILLRSGERLDMEYLIPRIKELSAILEKPEIFEKFNRLIEKTSSL